MANFALLDWIILVVSMILLMAFSVKTFGYVRGVADFLSSSRSAGRYLLSIARTMTGIGAISLVANFQMFAEGGWPVQWWCLMGLPVGLVVFLTGWVFYRFRETRCMTMAQFFGVRYSNSFRFYSGIVFWLAGIVNFGIFPAVASHFFVYFLGLPPEFQLLGCTIPTFAPIMVMTLGLALLYTCLGGQITVMAIDCAQGIICGLVFIVLAVVLLSMFSWGDVAQAMELAKLEENASLLDPFKTSAVKDFSIWFFLIGIFYGFYGYMSWQGSQGYFSSALNPHEQKMGNLIGIWRMIPINLTSMLLPICAITFLVLPKFAGAAAPALDALEGISNEALRAQMRVPVALGYVLPMGIKGIFCTIMIFFLITTQDTYLHSWGSIFIQDVVLPFRKKPLTPDQQLKLLRWSIVGVAIFAFVFSLVFKQREQVVMYMMITGAMVAGAGSCIIGGLYTKRGTSQAAWFAMTLGLVMAVGRIVLQQIGPGFKDVVDRGMFLRLMDWANAINSAIWSFYIMASCVVGYTVISLLTCREPFNLERMLHRGRYAVAGEHVEAKDAAKSFWWRFLGITQEFTRGDRLIAFSTVVWNFGWFGVFVAGTLYHFARGTSTESWVKFWKAWTWVYLILGVPTTIWLTFGGIRDLKRLFVRLKTVERDERDDGRVVDHHLVADEGPSDEAPQNAREQGDR